MAGKLIMAKSPAEAVAAKNASAAFLAGGTEVNRLGSPVDAETLISLKKCEGLREIGSDGACVRIGAMCSFQDLIESDKVPGYLKEAAFFMASRTKRNMATIGGNIAAKRDDSYLLPALITAGAVLNLEGKDSDFSVSVKKYVFGEENYEDSLITSVCVPAEKEMVSKRYANTAQSHAVLTMSAAMSEDGVCMAGAVKNVGLLHFCDLEERFRKDPDVSEEVIIDMVKNCEGFHTADDMFGSDAYKRYLIAVTACDLHRRLVKKEV